MVLKSEKWSQQMRNLFSISSLVLFGFLVYQVIKANFQFVPEKLYITEEELKIQKNKEFHAAETINSLELIEADQQCRYEDNSGITILPNDPITEKYCQCNDEILFQDCSSETNNYPSEDCQSIDIYSVQRDFIFLLDSDGTNPAKQVKFCLRTIDYSKIGFIDEQGVTIPEYTKQCGFSDTHKVGFIDISLQCPSSRLGFRCKDSSYKICETDFMISCIKLNIECPENKCAYDEIGCLSSVSTFCVKNTESCPLTNVRFIEKDWKLPSGYEELKIRFKSNYKLIAQRNSADYDYIQRFVINFSSYPYYKEQIITGGFKNLSLDEFLQLNKVELRYVQHDPFGQNYLPSFQRRNTITPNRRLYVYCSRLDNTIREEWNMKMQSIYNLEYPIRVWCMRLLFVKLFFDFVRFRITKHIVYGDYQKQSDKEEEINDQETKLGNIIDNCNILFFYLAEIILMVLLFTVFQKKFYLESDEDGYGSEDYYVPLCLADINKFNEWNTANLIFFLEKERYLEFIVITFFSLIKLITLYYVFKYNYFKTNRKDSTTEIQINQIEQIHEQSSYEIDLPKQ